MARQYAGLQHSRLRSFQGRRVASGHGFEGPEFFHIMGITMRGGRREFDTRDNATPSQWP